MRQLGKLWADCHNGTIDPKEWHYERRISINGRYFLDNEIVNLKFDKGLVYNNFVLGACISGKVDFTLRPLISMTFPSVGNITVELRVKALDRGESNWYMFGTYRIESVKESDEIWTFTGYDALSDKKADSKKNYYQPPKDQSVGALTFVKSVIDGWLTLANPGSIDDKIRVPIYPEALKEYDEYGRVTESRHVYDEYTRRELLSFIAQLNTGSFHIDENGDLKFVKVDYSASPVATVSKANSKRIVDGGPLRFSGITMRYSERRKQDVYNIGSSMNSLDMFNPLANIQSANSVYRAVMNMDYRAFNITSTQINPAIELGDRIKVGDKETNLWQITLSPRNFADIDIPNLVDQYVYSDRTENNSECILLSMVGPQDFVGSSNAKTYIGRAECVILDKGINGTGNNNYIFRGSETITRPILSNPSFGKYLRGAFSYILREREEGIDFSYFDTSQLHDADYMFRGSNMNNFNFDGLDLQNVNRLRNTFEDTFGDEIDLSLTIPLSKPGVYGWELYADNAFRNSKVKKLKLPFGMGLNTSGTFTGMKNLKHLDLSNVKLFTTGTDASSFQGLESLETLTLNNTSRTFRKQYNNSQGYSIYSFGDVTRPKYIDMRNFDNADHSGDFNRSGKVFDLSNLQHELTLNVSGNFTYKKLEVKLHFGTMRMDERHYKFLPNKLNQPEKLLVICDDSNIEDLMSHYRRFYIQPNGSTWEDHNIEFVVDYEFEWDYEED